MLQGGEESLSAGTEQVRHYQSSLLAPAVRSVEGGVDLDWPPQTGGAQDVGRGQPGLPLQQGVEAEDAVGRGVDGDALDVVDGERCEGEGARPLGSLRFDWLLAGLDLDKHRRLLLRAGLHLDLERAGAPVGRQDVLQLLLLSLESHHLLLQAPVLQLPVVDLHLQSLYLVQSLLPAPCCGQSVPVPPHLSLLVLLGVEQLLLRLPLVRPAGSVGVLRVDFVFHHAGHALQLCQDDVTIAPVRADHGGGASSPQTVVLVSPSSPGPAGRQAGAGHHDDVLTWHFGFSFGFGCYSAGCSLTTGQTLRTSLLDIKSCLARPAPVTSQR